MTCRRARGGPEALYRALRAEGRRPALLESLGPVTHFGRRTLLGADPVMLAEVRDGRLVVDGVERGAALDLVRPARGDDRGEAGNGRDAIFPCWIGFLSYEFARHVGLPANPPLPGLPEASFRLYRHGWLWESGKLVEAADGSCEPTTPGGRLPSLEIVSDYPPDAFIDGVLEVQERIRAGWVYQVNLSHRFHFDARGVDPLVCYERLRAVNPSPFFGIVEDDAWAVVSGSPERLFDVRADAGGGARVTARPIAGTRRRAAAPRRRRRARG